MDIKKIDWNHVTKYSQLIAIALFVAVFVLGFELGKTYEYHSFVNATLHMGELVGETTTNKTLADVTYVCLADKTIHAIYRQDEVQILLSDGRNLTLPHAISGSGARYANKDEAIVFWNKGNTAFITEGKDTTFTDCNAKPSPQ